ncbi:FAD-binding protein [Zhihengliuella sp.]|uniref:L-aspartate oxidase n=1 Tax=Zhihengliuella sp. TaxID=1954483 RepID=UPI002810D84E|nr:FAD-binding protein [Zhihengliuella sp.]
MAANHLRDRGRDGAAQRSGAAPGGDPTGPPRRSSSPGRLIVVGSGLAGLYAALAAAGRGLPVTLLTKDRLRDSNTWYAQGGIAAVAPAPLAAPGDSIASHVEDTLRAGALAGDEQAVRALCAEAWEHCTRLFALGVEFDRDAADPARYALGLEGAHRHPRILHHRGDATGRGIASALIAVVRRLASEGRIDLREHAFVTDLLVEQAGARPSRRAAGNDAGASPAPVPGAVVGVRFTEDIATTETADPAGEPTGASPGGPQGLRGAVLLATGGIGRLYPHTTNPDGATGDGAALALRAARELGVPFDLADAEFVQFHPTLWRPEAGAPLMITEAVRGEGAHLRNGHGERFMPGRHPDAELAPRDVVARAIHAERARTGVVHLDARHLADRDLAARFPTIAVALAAHGLDLGRDLVPVAEAQHYWMGGVPTDLAGRTALPGLWAAGETACTGVHGANRLASNSLLEALVFAWRAVADIAASGPAASAAPAADAARPDGGRPTGGAAAAARLLGGVATDWEQLHALTGTHLAVERDEAGLARAESGLAAMEAELLAGRDDSWDRDRHELLNAVQVAHRIAVAARRRTESLGAHHRRDARADAAARPSTPFFAPATPAGATREDRLAHA